MTTRFNAQSQGRFGIAGLPSGFQSKSAPDDLTIPSVGLADVDKALFDLFNADIPITVGGDGSDAKRVPVVFAAGEKWAISKRKTALRDRNNALILPLITVIRTSIVQTPDGDITGRGINQQTGEIVVHRRLDRSDRAYQGLINRLLIKHQTNVAVSVGDQDPGQVATLNPIGDLADAVGNGPDSLLATDVKNNVFETIVIPSPQFFTAQYDVTIWTQYTSHMNQVIEQLIASFLPQGNVWKLDTGKGYWFLANVDANTFTADMNADDYAQSERLVRYKFIVKVPAYIFASSVPGAPVPIKRYVSAPSISFEVGMGADITNISGDVVIDPFLGSDDPTLPLDPNDAASRRRDQRLTNGARLFPPDGSLNRDDPAVKSLPRGVNPQRYMKVIGFDASGKSVTRYVKIQHINAASGETVLAPDATLGGINITVVGG